MNTPIATADLIGYAEMYETCATLVETSPHPRLASAALLNATICIALGTLGAEALQSTLHRAIELIPAEDARARGRMN